MKEVLADAIMEMKIKTGKDIDVSLIVFWDEVYGIISKGFSKHELIEE